MARPAARDPLPPTEWPYPGRGVDVSVHDAALLLGVDSRTIYRMVEQDELIGTGDGAKMRINAVDLFVRAFHGTDRPRAALAKMLADAAREDLMHTADPMVRAVLTVTGVPDWLVQMYVSGKHHGITHGTAGSGRTEPLRTA